MELIDFSQDQKRRKSYAGANGSKISIIHDGELYMLKFPGEAKKNDDLSYSNSCISEYLGCHIYDSIGIPVQETLLGTYEVQEKQKIVVACKDFTRPGIILQDFASLKNQIIDSGHNGYGTDLQDVLRTFEKQDVIDPRVVLERFWDMFIVDALIGNWDRHNGNWGFLYDQDSDSVELAPVFDCGSCLYSQADPEIMQSVLTDKKQRDFRVFEIPLSALRNGNKKIKYFDFISSLENKDCNQALKRIVPRINLQRINELIEEVSCLNELQRNFYKTMLKERKEKILDFSLEKLKKMK